MLRGLRGVEQAPVEVSTERRTRPPRQRGIIVHETKDLTPNDHREHRHIACTSLVRTLVDLPAVVPKAKVAVECDSVEFHLSERAFRWERRRRRQLELLGWDTYEYTFHELKREPDMIVDQLRQALEIAAHRSPRPLLP